MLYVDIILTSPADTYIIIIPPESVTSGEAPDTVTGTERSEGEPTTTNLLAGHRHCAAAAVTQQ